MKKLHFVFLYEIMLLVVSVEDIVYDNVDIVIGETSLYFEGIILGYENIETVYSVTEPRRSLFVGLKEWFYGFVVMVVICNIWKNLMLLGDIYCLLLPVIIVFNIYMFFQKYYILVVRTTSGLEHYKRSKDYFLVEEIKYTINKAKDDYIKKSTASVIVNNGIISSGNNNRNKVINKKNTINYKKIEDDLKILYSNVKDNDKEIVKEAIVWAKEKNNNKLKKCLSKLGKGTLTIIKDLGLVVLEKYIESLL